MPPMIAAILCPGPSLNRWADDFEGLTIAVNRGAIAFSCDVWACGDYPLIWAIAGQVLRAGSLLTSGIAGEWLRKNSSTWRGETIEWEGLADFAQVKNWDFTTGTAALTFAISRGATKIITAGVDFSGEKDFDGAEGFIESKAAGGSDSFIKFGNRSNERWKQEKAIWDLLLEKFGVEWERA
jgi:hypothetical protein